MEILVNILLGLCGVLLFTLIKSKKYFLEWKPFALKKPQIKNKWSLKTLVSENFGTWVWSLIIICVLSFIIKYSPESLKFMPDEWGIDLSKKGAMLGLGLILSGIVKN